MCSCTQHHLWYMCVKNDISAELNQWIKRYGLFPGKSSFVTCFDFMKKNKKVPLCASASLLVPMLTTCMDTIGQGVASLTGGDMESLLQVLEVCLRGLLQQD